MRIAVPWLALLLAMPATAVADGAQLAEAALDRTRANVRYDGRYQSIPYPGGDVDGDIGVCTDVLVRSYRKLGIDLQVLVHEDMRDNFVAYPDNWGLTRPDPNIDHRRVPNLRTFFSRHGESLQVSNIGSDYQAGDVVSWMLPGNLPHIGIVSNQLSVDGERPLIVHNIGRGPRLEDMLFKYPVTGHYRYPANDDEPIDDEPGETAGDTRG